LEIFKKTTKFEFNKGAGFIQGQIGNIETPVLVIAEGALLKGDCQVPIEDKRNETKKISKKKNRVYFHN